MTIETPILIVDGGSIGLVMDPAIARLYERRLVLVRPDGHVAWRSDDPPADPLALADCVRGADQAAFATAANTEALPVGT